jgi:hypothetical protein
MLQMRSSDATQRHERWMGHFVVVGIMARGVGVDAT